MDGLVSGDTVRPVFSGTARSMAPTVFKGVFLTIVTLGVYRFWYVTNIRRYLWGATQVGGHVLEYTGRGVELFIGFLIALAVLIPLYGVLFLVGLTTGPAGAAIMQSVSTLALLFLAQFALYRARRYRLTRTIWRGVRFQQSGSGLAYAARSFGWGLLTIVTLGLAYPFMRASLERYKMTNTWYGDQQGAFSATGWGLFRRGIWVWLAAIVALAATAALIAAIVSVTESRNTAPSTAEFGLAASPLLPLALIALLIPIYLAIEYRWWANGCSIGPATAACDLGLFSFFSVYARYVGIVLSFAIVVGLVAGLGGYLLSRGNVFETDQPGSLAQFGIAVAVGAAYFVVALTFAALWQLFGVRPLWARSFGSVEIAGLSALTAAQSSEPPATAFGEGVADALDFGGF